MKNRYLKKLVIISVMMTLMLATTLSCRKEPMSHNQKIGQLVPLGTNAKTENQYVLFFFMGHDASKCPGCLYVGGSLAHIDCQGVGSACRKASAVALTYDIDNNLIATTVDTFGLTDLDVLNMPSRSFALEIDEGVYSYLNIPAQLVYRDSVTLQFTFTGLSFTCRPLYGNN